MLKRNQIISGKNKRLNELKLIVVSLKEIQDCLKSKVVNSPEKVKDPVQKLQSSQQEVLEKYELYRDSG